MSIPDNNSFLYTHENGLFHFIYMKATNEQRLKIFLTDAPEYFKPYMCVFFDSDGREYLGHLNADEICELIDRCDMKELLNNNYETIKSHFPALTTSDFEEKVAFTKYQFESF